MPNAGSSGIAAIACWSPVYALICAGSARLNSSAYDAGSAVVAENGYGSVGVACGSGVVPGTSSSSGTKDDIAAKKPFAIAA